MTRSIAIAALAASLGLAAEAYREAYRPQFHFSPRINWTNDPCGIVYSNGEYHLFFQFNPLGNLWGHMSWGHAVSPDLVRWKELPVAIPEADAMIFTGSSVVDKNNTSGLCKPGTSCIVSIYTGHTPKTETKAQNQSQHLAWSQDGRVWTKYKGNPVLDIGLADFRDPKVFWHEPGKQWVMIVVLAREKKASLYGSPNLKDWKRLSDFGPEGATGGVWECPDLYELPVDGKRSETRWVLKIGLNPGHVSGGSGEQYFIGTFDGRRFHNENSASETRWLDYGRDCYCALSWSGEYPGRAPHMIGWMNNWQYARSTPTDPWRGAMTLPRTLGLRRSASGIRLTQTPVPGLESLRREAFTYQGRSVQELNQKLAKWPHRSQTFEVEAIIRPGAAKQVAWKLLEGLDEYTLVGYDAGAKQLFVDRSSSAHKDFHERFPSRTVAPLDPGKEPLNLHIFVDRSSVEVFSDNNQVVMTNLVFPKPDSSGISMVADGGGLDRVRVNLWRLESAWSAPKH